MSAKSFVLGASDPEMEAIGGMSELNGYCKCSCSYWAPATVLDDYDIPVCVDCLEWVAIDDELVCGSVANVGGRRARLSGMVAPEEEEEE
jgi:hypothetical protein